MKTARYFEGDTTLRAHPCAESDNPDLSDIAIVHQIRIEVPGAFERLFRRYYRRLIGLARRYFAPGADRDDMVQEATIGFYKATRDYRSDRGTFAAFVDLCVRRQLITFIKTSTREKHAALNRSMSLDAPVFDNSDQSLIETIPSSEVTDYQDEEEKMFLARLWGRCSQLERGILALYTKGFSFQEMADELHVHRKAVDNAVWRVKVKARRLLTEFEAVGFP